MIHLFNQTQNQQNNNIVWEQLVNNDKMKKLHDIFWEHLLIETNNLTDLNLYLKSLIKF